MKTQQKELVRAMRNKDDAQAVQQALEIAKANKAIADLSTMIVAKMNEFTTRVDEAKKSAVSPEALEKALAEIKSEVTTLAEKSKDFEVKLTGSLGAQNAPECVKFDVERLKHLAAGNSGSYSVRTTEKALTNTPQAATAGNVTPAAVAGWAMNASLNIGLYNWLTKLPVTATNAVAMLVETVFTNNAAGVAEGAQKPTTVITLELNNFPIETIAHILPVPLQMLADVPQLQAYMAQRLVYGLTLVREDKVLNAAGSSVAIKGILVDADAYTQVNSPIDTVLEMIGAITTSGYTADAVVMNTSTRVKLQLEKDANGNYLMGGPNVPTMPMIWGLPVIISEKMPADTVAVGAWKMAAAAHEREDINVAISYENKDNFEKNMATVRAEARLALSITRQDAFLKCALDFDLPAP